MYRNLWSDGPSLEKSDIRLTAYTEEAVPVVRTINVEAVYNEQKKNLKLQVVGNDGPSLLGSDWLKVLTLDWP